MTFRVGRASQAPVRYSPSIQCRGLADKSDGDRARGLVSRPTRSLHCHRDIAPQTHSKRIGGEGGGRMFSPRRSPCRPEIHHFHTLLPRPRNKAPTQSGQLRRLAREYRAIHCAAFRDVEPGAASSCWRAVVDTPPISVLHSSTCRAQRTVAVRGLFPPG